LLICPTDLNTHNSRGRTPLHIAALNGNQNIVTILLDRQEVNIDSKDMDGVTPSRLAFYGMNTHICGLIELEKTIRVKAARERINEFQDALKDKNLDDVKRHMFDPCSSWAQLVTADEGEIQCAPNIYIRHICGALGDKFVRIIEVGNEYKVVKNKVATKSES
jgi:hypothetical protein